MEMPKTREEALKIITECYDFVNKNKKKEYRDGWLAREMDIVFSKGYDKDEFTNVLFCVKGSPNKMMGFIERIGLFCPKCNKSFEGLRVTTSWGIFSFCNDNIYSHCYSLAIKDLRSCKGHTKKD